MKAKTFQPLSMILVNSRVHININMSAILIIIALAFGSNAINAQKVLQLSFDEASGTATATDSITNTNYGIDNNFNRPERIAGVHGNALRLDGWSTLIEENGYQFSGISNQMTIEAWHATEAFSAENAGIISQINGPAGFSLEITSFGKVIFAFHLDGQFYIVFSNTALQKYQWNHIAATIDAANQTAKIFINGVEDNSLALGAHNNITFTTGTPLYIGRQTNDPQFAGFSTSILNGALDELTVYSTVLSNATIQNHYQEGSGAVPDLFIDPAVRHQGDELRPQYHPMPNTSWTNEPYGLTYYNGKYHLFFQKNPNGPYLYFMHWGHLSSPDLVNWTEEKIPLAPDEAPGFDDFGVWSGTTAFDANGVPQIFYTGVNGSIAAMGSASPLDNDLIEWQKNPNNPIIAAAPTAIPNLDFRDPYVWQEGANDYRMVIGSGRQNPQGGMLFQYESSDMQNWTYKNVFYYNFLSQQNTSYFWEMPTVYKFNSTDYFTQITYTPNAGNGANSVYWIGSQFNDLFSPYDTDPKQTEIFYGQMLAPAFGLDSAGNFMYIGILPENDGVNEQIARGWRNIFTLPRWVTLGANNRIEQKPHPKLNQLRGDHYQITNRTITNNGAELNIPEIESRQMEMRFQITMAAQSIFTIHLFKHIDKQEKTLVTFNSRDNRISLNTNQSGLNTQGISTSGAYEFSADGKLDVTIYIDRSTVEVFVDGKEVASGRCYPTRTESDKIDLVVFQGEVTIDTLDAWQMANNETIYTGVNVGTNNLTTGEPKFSIVPNPNAGIFEVQFTDLPNAVDTFDYQITDVQGRVVEARQGMNVHQPTIKTDLAAGVYFITITIGKEQFTQRLVRQ